MVPMENLPPGAVQVTPASLPSTPPPGADGFEGLDLDKNAMRDMVLKNSKGEGSPEPTPQADTRPTPTDQVPTPGTHEAVGTKAERPDTKTTTPPADGDIPEDVFGDEATVTEPEAAEPEETSEEDTQLIENMDEKARSAFIKMRQELATLRKETTDATKLKTQLTETQKKLAMHDLKESPEFQRTYVAPMEAKWGEIALLAKEFSVDRATLDKALRAPLRERVTLLNEEAPEIAPTLINMMGDLNTLNKNRIAALAAHENTVKELRAREKAEANTRVAKAVETATETLRQNKHFLLRPSKDNEDWNKQVAERIQRAQTSESLLSDPTSRAETLLRAQLADEYRDLYLRSQAELNALKGKGERVRRATPGVRSASTPVPAQAQNERKARSADSIAGILEQRDYSHLDPRQAANR